MSVLEISGVNKTFGGLRALDDVNLKIEEKTVMRLSDRMVQVNQHYSTQLSGS